MKIIPSQSVLLIIDIQEKLLPAIEQNVQILGTAAWAVNLAENIGIPVIATEHFPCKIGLTVSELRKKIDGDQIISKTYFSAVPEGELLRKIPDDRKQIIVSGTEAHVCVLQTVLDMVEKGYEVFILESGIGSRKESDKVYALARMKQNGVEVITKEMLAFEWLEKGGTDLFKDVLQKFIK